MNLYQLRYFLELAEKRQYTKAARQLNITQPSLSYAISQLENELGVKLFEKDGRTISLTDCGRDLAGCASESLAILDKGIANLPVRGRSVLDFYGHWEQIISRILPPVI